jgi:hypothetical protein
VQRYWLCRDKACLVSAVSDDIAPARRRQIFKILRSRRVTDLGAALFNHFNPPNSLFFMEKVTFYARAQPVALLLRFYPIRMRVLLFIPKNDEPWNPKDSDR